jgi:spore germination protein KB
VQMEKAKINANQLFAMMFLFEIGTAIVLPVGFASVQSVWMAIIIALVFGIGLYLIYNYLFREYPGLPLSGYIKAILGKPIGWVVNLSLLLFLIHNDARVLRETSELLVTSSYDMTPLFVISALMIVAVIYVLHKGVEVIARVAEIYLLFFLFLSSLGFISIIFSNIIDIKNLFPLLGKGWKPVFKAAFPRITSFPFGETISFATILPYLNKPVSGRKTGIFALIASGLILSFSHAIEICVLGPDIYARSTFPLFLMITRVNIADFVQRMDAFVILTLIIGAFFKCAIHMYAAMSVAADLFHMEIRKMALPVGITILVASYMLASNWAEFLAMGKEVITSILIPIYGMYLPIFLVIVHLIRKKLFKKS